MPAERTRTRLWALLFAFVAVASAFPILTTRYLPFTDVPEHVAAIATMDRLLRGVGNGDYQLALSTSQYLLYDVVGALVARVLGNALLANRLMLAAIAIAWPLSFRSFLKAIGRDERLAIFAAMIFWNRAVVIGFLPFVAGVPLAILGLAVVVRQSRQPTWPRSAGLLVLAIVLFYTHVSAWMFFMSLAGVLYAILTLPRVSLRSIASSVGPLLPSAICAAVWWRSGSLSRLDNHELAERQDLTQTLGAVPVWTFDAWRTHLDEVCAIGWWLAFTVIFVKTATSATWPTPQESRRDRLLALAPFVCGVAVYLATPFSVGNAVYLNVRLAPLVVMFALLWLRPRRDLWGTAPLLAAALLALVTSANAMYEMNRASKEMLGDFDRLLAQIRPGATLANLNFESRSRRLHYFPYVYAGSYHRVVHEAVVFYSFTDMPHWPIHYAPGARPPSKFTTFTPCAYRYRSDGAFYDYLLIQGTFDPFTDAPIGPKFWKVTTSGSFSLFQKVGPSENDGDGPDRGPCPPR